ncbi:hypothetical protein L6452_37158 [Arctium lappa]|uniref:Uncharacterized protein n=1 Tax=Arctium lappa TaxID=4217 RepID=A0ACB8Y267_ARCLA|nr:hypothetical protein L6452_37158 [Arctium lappa]
MDSAHRPTAEVVVVMLPFVAHRTGKQFPADLQILNRLPSQDGCLSPEFQEFVKLQLGHDGFHVGTLLDSSRAIEGEYIEYLEKEEEMKNDKNKKKLWALGLINSGQQTLVTVSENRHECLQWLDLQPLVRSFMCRLGPRRPLATDRLKSWQSGYREASKGFYGWLESRTKGMCLSMRLR